MADKTKITTDWSNADQFLRERYEPTKKYVDNQINPEFVYDETAVSTKVVPQDVGDFAIVSTICGKTIKEGDTLKSAPIESVVSVASDNEVTARSTISATMTILTENTRARSNIYEYASKNIVFKATSKSGKTIKVCVMGFTSSKTRVDDSVWLSSEGAYTLTGNDVKYVCLLFKYSDDSTIIYDDITLEWNQGDKTTISVPDSIKNLPDYGVGISDTLRNFVDFETGKYSHFVIEGKLLDLFTTWSVSETSSYKVYYGTTTNKKTGLYNLICDAYDLSTTGSWADMPDKTVVGNNSAMGIAIKDSSSADLAAFKTKNANTKIAYELATPEVIDISDIIPPIRVESGGTVTLQNEHSLDVANTIIYKKEVLT